MMIDSMTRPAVAEIANAAVSNAALASRHHGISTLRRVILSQEVSTRRRPKRVPPEQARCDGSPSSTRSDRSCLHRESGANRRIRLPAARDKSPTHQAPQSRERPGR